MHYILALIFTENAVLAVGDCFQLWQLLASVLFSKQIRMCLLTSRSAAYSYRTGVSSKQQ